MASPKTLQPNNPSRDNPGCLEPAAHTKVSGITLVELFDKDTGSSVARAGCEWDPSTDD